MLTQKNESYIIKTSFSAIFGTVVCNDNLSAVFLAIKYENKSTYSQNIQE